MSYTKKIEEVKRYLQKYDIDGWLMYDFRGANDLMYDFLDITDIHATRRILYWIPKDGDPIKIVHSIEAHLLDKLPGDVRVYVSWDELHSEIFSVLSDNIKTVAMEYSHECDIPYVAKVDAGTIELIRKKVEVVSSAHILPHFTAVLTDEQKKYHFDACRFLEDNTDMIWKWITEKLQSNKKITEYDVQQKILEDFDNNDYITDSPPNCSVNANAANPHYCPTKTCALEIKPGDFILIDKWCKKNHVNGIYGDITRVAVASNKTLSRHEEIFDIVRLAQKTASDFITQRLNDGETIQGYEVDKICRSVIVDKGYGKFFTHRTGHNIEKQVHGSGANLDNIEAHDTREILPGTCFSIEPGIYLPGEFGVRLEHDVYISKDRKVNITGGVQEEIVKLL
jgi:Xaa-Pro dipeptidase